MESCDRQPPYNKHNMKHTTTTAPPRAAKVNPTAKPTAPPDRPEWGDCRAVHARFGIGKSTLYRLEAEGKIRACSLRERGKLRGKKLWSMDSVAQFIERMATANQPAA